MGNALAEKKRGKENCVGIQKKLDEEEKRYQRTVKMLIMGQGTVNFLNALQCIRDNGIDDSVATHCRAYIYHQMIFEMKSIVKKSIEKSANGGIIQEWSSELFKHCVTDSLLIYGFIKSFMVYDRKERKYSMANREVIWNTSDLISGNSVNDTLLIKNDTTTTNYTINSNIMESIIKYYQSHDTVQQWLDLLFLKRSNNSSVINHYILNNVDIGHFILDLFNEFNNEQQNKLLNHYDLGVAHYFSDLERISSAHFYPEAKDIILMSKSIGFRNELKDIEFKSSLYHFTNIQPMFRTAVKRWIYQFEDHDALIFLIPLTTYYKWDSKWDTFNLIKNFQIITNNNWLKSSSFHLFLTGKELFKSDLKHKPFKFSNYSGDTIDDKACIDFLIQYLKSKLIADNKGDKRQIYIHVVSLYHLDQLEAAFTEVYCVLNKDTVQENEPEHHTQISSQKFEL